MTARQAAIDLIKPYVLRGDNPQWIAGSYMGSCNSEYWASIGGLANDGRHYGKDKIVVSEVDGREVNAVFPFQQIYDEIQRGTSQAAML